MQLSLNSGRVRVEDRALPTRWLRREQGTLALHVWGKNTKQVCDEVDHKWKMQNTKSNWRRSSFSIIIHGNFPGQAYPLDSQLLVVLVYLGVFWPVLTFFLGGRSFHRRSTRIKLFSGKTGVCQNRGWHQLLTFSCPSKYSFNIKCFPNFFVILPVCSTFSLFQARLESQLCFTL